MIHRRIDTTLGELAPWAIGVLFVGGVVLIVMGVPGLRKQEDLERRKLEGELQEQSSAETTARLKAEVAGELGEQFDALLPWSPQTPPPPPAPPPVTERKPTPAPDTDEIRRQAADRYLRASQVEREVLERLAIVAPPTYEFRDHVRLGQRRLDAALVSTGDRPDLLVEIRARRQLTTRDTKTMSTLDETVVAYEEARGRAARGWLIIVSDERASRTAVAQLMGLEALYEDRVRLTVTSPADLPNLELPSA